MTEPRTRLPDWRLALSNLVRTQRDAPFASFAAARVRPHRTLVGSEVAPFVKKEPNFATKQRER